MTNHTQKGTTPLLTVKSLSAGVIKSASFQLSVEETLMVMGPSGSGKSCLLKGIADLIPNHGEVYLEDREKNTFSPDGWRKKVQFVPAESRWWFPTAAEHFNDVPNESLLASIALTKEELSKPINHLSTGQKQRLALLRAFQSCPQVLLLDEPTASLDEKSTALVETAIQHYKAEHQCAVVWVTHAVEQAKKQGDSYIQLPDLSKRTTLEDTLDGTN